jgi:putative colanic acid biosynthesis glycosyltransferase WcaI
MTGIAPYTTELAEHYASQGHDVRVVTGVPHYPEWRRLPIPAPNGVKNPGVLRFRHFVPRRPNAIGRMAYEATWLLSASRSLAGTGVDAVVGIVPSMSGGLLAVIGGRRWRAPVGLVVKDLMGPAAAQSGYSGGGAVAGLTARVEARILRKADRVGIISDGFRRYLRAAGVADSRIHRLRDWTHPGVPTESKDMCRARLGWSLTDFVCLHAGNMGQKQGLDTVLDAAPPLADDVRLVLAGNGNDRQRLIQRAERLRLKNVSFLPLQPAGQFEAMLRTADVLLLSQRPSVGDMSLPSKLASYMAAGRPIVAAVALESEAAREIQEARAGIVVPAGDPAALAHAVNALRNARQEAQALGSNGRAYASSRLTATAALSEYDDFLTRLISVSDLS